MGTKHADAPTVEVPSTRLNPTDATLWDIERNPTLRTTIVAALVLDRPVRRDALLAALEAASRLIPRLRQRVVGAPGGLGPPHWVIDDGFDVGEHVSFVETNDPVDDPAIAAVAEPLASSPLDRSRPLWECTYLGGDAGPSAVVLKVHHSLTDGVGGIDLLDVLLDRKRRAPRRDLASIPIPCRPEGGGSGLDDVGRLVGRASRLPRQATSVAASSALHPRRTVESAVEGARSAVRLLAPSSSTLSPLMLERSMERHTGMCEVDLAAMHDAAARHGCTINHAFFAGVIGGVAAYHEALGAPVEQLRVTMPVSFRRADDEGGGNQWAPVRFVVPADIDDPVERMVAMRGLVVSSRREKALGFSQHLAGLVQVLPSVLSSGIVGGMVRGVDMTLTNVPGLSDPHYLAGAAVERIFAFAPTAGAALNVGLVSHLGTACVGTMSDTAAVTEPALLDRLIAEHLTATVEGAAAATPTRLADPSEPPAPRPGGERLSALDTGFLRIESPETPMHIGGVFVLDGAGLRDEDGAIRLADARRHIEARLRRVPRFTCRVADVPLGLGRPLWVDDDRFDIAQHVRLVDVAAPGDRQALLDLCARLYADPLDRRHPLWELWFVDGLEDGRVAIIEKVHHALIDGVSGVELAAALFDPEPDDRAEHPVRRPARPSPSQMRLLGDAVTEQLTDPIDTLRRAASMLRTSPSEVADQLGSVAAATREMFGAHALAPPTPFNRPIGRHRELRTVRLELDDVHRIRHPADATVNDLVLACMAGAMRRWFDAEGEPPADVHVLVPVSMRRATMSDEPGNHVGSVVIELPVGEPDPQRRLHLVQSRMRRLKRTHEGEGTALLLDALDHVPAPGFGALTRLVAVQPLVNFVVTNVFGLADPLYFLGSRIEDMVPVVPLGPRLGLGVAVLSYVDGLTISLFADPDACHDLDVLAEAITDEFELLDGTSMAAAG
ncbi:MAG: wax ester/triacylglycerol synthase family O-acyltransferase [Ilumatobacter sp.]|uniref:wax ester/triacylglycerol synthase family O-acyltransferase n=1 Tax=Ilumatobacter sp. TaxID=1967498 RepID=UPI00262F8D6E|nr:wax ester/triacylglycerol synthase family O-acyltransferase [Ilumatobacter sp.]MDJ0769339.1 wax ester/triacylglycerol synthase family O-acyltransferase [Ilumatobacter sp.]